MENWSFSKKKRADSDPFVLKTTRGGKNLALMKAFFDVVKMNLSSMQICNGDGVPSVSLCGSGACEVVRSLFLQQGQLGIPWNFSNSGDPGALV